MLTRSVASDLGSSYPKLLTSSLEAKSILKVESMLTQGMLTQKVEEGIKRRSEIVQEEKKIKEIRDKNLERQRNKINGLIQELE
jgi:hypothetical protein